MTALPDVVGSLACPICREPMTVDGGSLVCAHGHTFDIARQGYASLVTGSDARVSDTAEMVLSRETFLSAGHYRPIASAVVRALSGIGPGEVPGGLVVDLAGGTGYYAVQVVDAFPGDYAVVVDLSKYALRRAARAHDRVAAVAADVWNGIPVQSGAASAVLSIFGPRNPGEIARILAPGGVLVVVTPGREHLQELRATLGLLDVDSRKAERLAAQLADFRADDSAGVEYVVELSHDDVFTAAMMGPNAFHRDPAEIRALIADLDDPFAVTVSVRVSTFRPRHAE